MTADLRARLARASKPGARHDPNLWEAVEILDAIDDHEANPRDFSVEFIARQKACLERLLCS